MQFYRLQYVSILENNAFLADLPSKSFLPSFTGKRKFTGHLPVNRWSGKISQITTLVSTFSLLFRAYLTCTSLAQFLCMCVGNSYETP